MSEFENTPIMMFSQTKKKRKHRSPQQKLARKQDKENSLSLTRISLENIMKFYEAFSDAYKHNNVYGLFNASEGFYNNSIEFISQSTYLYKHKLVKIKDIDYSTIIENMDTLNTMIEHLNAERMAWISESNILIEPEFTQSVEEGTHRINMLNEKITTFLNKTKNSHH